MIKNIGTIFLLLLLTGCGEAVFFQHLKINDQAQNNNEIIKIIKQTSDDLGYKHCEWDVEGISYCNNIKHYTYELKSNSSNTIELKFIHSFGSSPPNVRSEALEEFAQTLRIKYPNFGFQIKNSSISGFIKEETEWNNYE